MPGARSGAGRASLSRRVVTTVPRREAHFIRVKKKGPVANPTYAGIFQADAFGGYNRLYEADRKPGQIVEAACWVHARRPFFRAPGSSIPTPSCSPQAARSEPQSASASSSHTGSAGRSASAQPRPPATQLPHPRARIMRARKSGEGIRETANINCRSPDDNSVRAAASGRLWGMKTRRRGRGRTAGVPSVKSPSPGRGATSETADSGHSRDYEVAVSTQAGSLGYQAERLVQQCQMNHRCLSD